MDYENIAKRAKKMADTWDAIPNKPWTLYGWSAEDQVNAFIEAQGKPIIVTDEMTDARYKYVIDFSTEFNDIFDAFLAIEINKAAIAPSKKLHDTYYNDKYAFRADYESLKNINEAAPEMQDTMMAILTARYLINTRETAINFGNKHFDDFITKFASILLEVLN